MKCQSCDEPRRRTELLGGQSRTGHCYCFDCFPHYMNNLTAQDFVNGIPRCPDFGCDGKCITSKEFGIFLAQAGPGTMGRYVEIIQTLTAPPRAEPFMLKLQSCLEVLCPGCDAVQDPMPDGCRAMRCGGCNTFYCWICMGIFDTSAACHAHVSDIHNNHRGPYTSQDIVNAGHLELRKTRLRALMRKYSDRKRQQLITQEVRRLLNSVDPSLVNVALNPHNPPAAPQPVPPVRPARAAPARPAANANANANALDGRGDVGVGMVHGAAAGTAKVVAEKIGVKIAAKTVTEVSSQTFAKMATKYAASAVAETTVKSAAASAAATTTTTVVVKSAIGTAVSTASKAVSSSAIGAAAVEILFIGYDGARLVTGYLPRQHAGAQLRNRLANLTMNASGSAIGAGVGTLICPGWGTFAGSVIGSMVTGTQNYKVM